eukprot:TRINITY_DN2275_c0_g4_i1.p1 TRINITY_DN2275_c0_g4~~TRINITY_DN2275_c0_g4_i1.p1  ORF type:complete len:533 (-),score=126.51 TRINITY_DN2275_c0_g4_i1:32-1579(-)
MGQGEEPTSKISGHRAREFMKTESTRKIFHNIAERKIRELVTKKPQLAGETTTLKDFSKFIVGSTVQQFKNSAQNQFGDRLVSHDAVLHSVLKGSRRSSRLFNYEKDLREIESRTAVARMMDMQEEIVRQLKLTVKTLEDNAAELSDLRLKLFNEGKALQKACTERDMLARRHFDQSSKVLYAQSVEAGRRPGVNDRRGLDSYVSWHRDRQATQERITALEAEINKSRGRQEELTTGIDRAEKDHTELKARKKQLKLQLTDVLRDLTATDARHGTALSLLETLRLFVRHKITIPKDVYPAVLEPGDVDFLERLIQCEAELFLVCKVKPSYPESPNDKGRRRRSFFDEVPQVTRMQSSRPILMRSNTRRVISHLKTRSLTKLIKSDKGQSFETLETIHYSPSTLRSEEDPETARINDKIRILKDKYLEDMRAKEIPRIIEQPARIEVIRQRLLRMFGPDEAEILVNRLKSEAKANNTKSPSISNKGDSIFYRPSTCLLYTSPSPRDRQKSRMPSSA